MTADNGPRDFTAEARDLPGRPYAFSFDYVAHGYLMQVFKPHFRGWRALELGCYRGQFTKRIAQHFKEVTIVDGSSELVHEASVEARKLVATRNIAAAFETVNLQDESFDAVFMIHALEHVDDPVLVLKRIKGWLKPEGRLYLAVPNAHAASRRLAVLMGIVESCESVTEGERTHGHRRTYSSGALIADITDAGLAVVERGGIMFKPLANFQADAALQKGIINRAYLDACYELGKEHPEMCASLYAVCSR